MIEEYFNLNEDNKKEEEKKLKRNINPDEVIAEGAALVVILDIIYMKILILLLMLKYLKLLHYQLN